MQGRLRKETVSAEIETRCKHCDQAMHIKVDSDLQVSVREADADPLVFMPDVDWDHFSEQTIIDSY